MRPLTAALVVVIIAALYSCGPTVTVRHKVEPIHVTVDVYVRVERELEKFFEFEEEFETKTESGSIESGQKSDAADTSVVEP